jgi:archaellum biogenesis ATPase FlaH
MTTIAALKTAYEVAQQEYNSLKTQVKAIEERIRVLDSLSALSNEDHEDEIDELEKKLKLLSQQCTRSSKVMLEAATTWKNAEKEAATHGGN